MTSNSAQGKSFTLRNRWGINIPPGKKGINIVICHLACVPCEVYSICTQVK